MCCSAQLPFSGPVRGPHEDQTDGCVLSCDPQTGYRPATAFESLSAALADPVEPAAFPMSRLRWRNQRHAARVGLGHLTDADWISHFAGFRPLPGSLSRPLAMRYHGHQFGTYNPQLGDGRGFLFAQLYDPAGRLLDLGTKGSGQTPWSRQGDGRLTLKGGVREILAAAFLEASGVSSSKAFSLVETGEALARNDEPSPARSSVLVRLSHSHIRFGTFQRCAWFEDRETMAALIDYCIAHFYPEADHAGSQQKAAGLLEGITRNTGRMIGQWMAAGFVHGVMNTDNFNITGETFDFGPWRFLPVSDPDFTAAYFDHQGLYRFARQPTQGLWALEQLASALLLVGEAGSLAQALTAYQDAYLSGFSDHTHALLGLRPLADPQENTGLLRDFYAWMTESGAGWGQTFFDWFGGPASEQRAAASPQAALYAEPSFNRIRQQLCQREPERPGRLSQAYFGQDRPVTLLIEDVEALWKPIAEEDDWSAFRAVMGRIEEARQALSLQHWPHNEEDVP